MTDTKSFEQRIVELETRLAHQEHALDDLSHIIQRQGGEMDALKRAFQQLHSRVGSSDEKSPQDDKPPPHY